MHATVNYSWLRNVLALDQFVYIYLPPYSYVLSPTWLLHPTSTRLSHLRTLILTDLFAVVFLCFCRVSPPFSRDDQPLSARFLYHAVSLLRPQVSHFGPITPWRSTCLGLLTAPSLRCTVSDSHAFYFCLVRSLFFPRF